MVSQLPCATMFRRQKPLRRRCAASTRPIQAVKIQPDRSLPIYHMRGKKPKATDPTTQTSTNSKILLRGVSTRQSKRWMKNQIEHFKYGKKLCRLGSRSSDSNSIAEVSFGWDGAGKLADALTADTVKFLLKVEKAFPAAFLFKSLSAVKSCTSENRAVRRGPASRRIQARCG